MPRTPRPRTARTAAATTAAVLVVGAGLASAPAASAADPVQYTASTTTGVVDLVLTLPAALPSVPNPAELVLLGTEGDAVGKTKGSDSSETASYLGGGDLVDNSPLSPLLAPLANEVDASLSSPGPTSATALAVPTNPLGLAVDAGKQSASVVPGSRANAASSTLATASLGSLRSLGLGAVLDPLFAGLDTAASTLVAQATPLTAALSALPSLPSVPVPNPLQPVTGGPATIPTPTLGGSTLATTVGELPARLKALEAQLSDGALLSLTGLDTSQGITPTASQVVGTGRSKLGKATLFGGLVTVDASEASATAKAGLTRATASADASATLVTVTVADSFGQLLDAVASDKGLTAGLLDGSLGTALDPTVRPTVAAVDSGLNALLAQLTGLLKTLGGGAGLITQGTVSKTVSADGRTSEAHAAPAEVVLGLPGAAKLVDLSVGLVDARAAVTPAAVVAAPTVVQDVPHTLPRTGASTGAGVAALVLVGTGLVLVRRRRASA